MPIPAPNPLPAPANAVPASYPPLAYKLGDKVATQDQFRTPNVIKTAICASFNKSPKECNTILKDLAGVAPAAGAGGRPAMSAATGVVGVFGGVDAAVAAIESLKARSNVFGASFGTT